MMTKILFIITIAFLFSYTLVGVVSAYNVLIYGSLTWYEPNKAIVLTEMVLGLFALTYGGIWLFRKIWRDRWDEFNP